MERRIGPYRVERHLRWGSQAELVLARDPEDRVVVLKLLAPHLHSETVQVERLLAEGRLGTVVHHPGLVETRSWGMSQGRPYVVLEHIAGHNLESLMETRALSSPGVPVPGDRPVDSPIHSLFTPFPLAWVVHRGIELAEALGYLHNLRTVDPTISLVHRDISPANVMITPEGHARIIDLGFAALTDVEPGTLLGTVAYAAPEQLAGRTVDARADIFSLGVLLYELLSGGRLFARSNTAATLLAVFDAPIPPPACTDLLRLPALESLFARSLARDPDERFASMADLIEALRWLC